MVAHLRPESAGLVVAAKLHVDIVEEVLVAEFFGALLAIAGHGHRGRQLIRGALGRRGYGNRSFILSGGRKDPKSGLASPGHAANWSGSVLDCIKPNFCDQILILQLFCDSA